MISNAEIISREKSKNLIQIQRACVWTPTTGTSIQLFKSKLKLVTKALTYLISSGALTVFILLDLADYFKGGLRFA